tara:strand:- start:572 stop:1651 length:1080 start_codon:yes stop_codon:yes gene_type:complete
MAFKSLDPEDFVVSSDSVTSTVWSNNSPSLNTFFTSSTQTEGTSGPYYINVYQTASLDDTAAVQFQIAYANKNGGGGVNFDSSVPFVSPTTTIYGQYRTLILEDENSNFVWGETFTGSADNDFYVISIERARYKQSLLPGTLNLFLSSSNENATNTPVIKLTDNSGMVTLPTFYGTQRVYQLISGSDGVAYNAGISGGTGFTQNSGSYGWFCPDISTILLNAAALDDNSPTGGGINIATVTGSDEFGGNPTKLYNCISGSVGLSGVDNIFDLNSQETISSDYVFIRARNNEFNYTENPSFISGSTGEVIYPYFINNPQTFPTTVGMYNDSNDLLAVAKLSRPIQKDFTKEALIRVKLDF